MFKTLSEYWGKIQESFFPELEEILGPLTEKQFQLVGILEMARIEQFLPTFFGHVGRPLKDRKALARAFITKSVYNMDQRAHPCILGRFRLLPLQFQQLSFMPSNLEKRQDLNFFVDNSA